MVVQCHLMVTRFDNKTLLDNFTYRARAKLACFYGCPMEVAKSIPLDDQLLVIEMNNDTNAVAGIGLVRNRHLPTSQYRKVYESAGYNRYNYSGKYWLPRYELERLDAELVRILDTILFVGKTHAKRGIGITRLPPKLFTHEAVGDRKLLQDIRILFRNCFLTESSPLLTSASPDIPAGLSSSDLLC